MAQNIFKNRKHQIIASTTVAIGGFGMGSVVAWTSPALPDMEKSQKFGKLHENKKEWIGPIMPLASLIAGPITGILIENYGRKRVLLFLTLPFTLGWLLISLAENIFMIYMGRFITGFCAGSYSFVCPIFISEIAENDIRGRLGSICQVMVTLGILYTYVAGTFISWNWLSLLSAFVPVLFASLLVWIPESPQYLLSQGKTSEALKSLSWFRGTHFSQDVEKEILMMQNSIDEAKIKTVSWKELVSPTIRKPTFIILGLMIFQQLSGIDAVIFYTVKIFEDVGTNIDPNVSTIIIGIVQVLSFFLSSILIDRIGRRILLLFSDSLMAISLLLLGLYFKFSSNDTSIKHTFGWLPLFSLIIFLIAFSIGFGPVPYIMMGEILPNHVVGMTAGIAMCMNWTIVFLVTFFFERLQTQIGIDWTYWMFSCFCSIGTCFVLFFVPETKCKSLDQIQLELGNKNINL